MGYTMGMKEIIETHEFALAGGDKKSQDKDIQTALELACNL